MNDYDEFRRVVTDLVIGGQGEGEYRGASVTYMIESRPENKCLVLACGSGLDRQEQKTWSDILVAVLQAATRAGKGAVISGPTVTEVDGITVIRWVMVDHRRLFSLGVNARERALSWLQEASQEKNEGKDWKQRELL